jgi:hypothetical protein
MTTEKKGTSDMGILGINLAIFAVYTGFGLMAGEDALFGVFILAIIHGFITFLMAIIQRRWIWVLAGLLIWVIGFGTCVSNLHLGNMH